MCTVASFPSRDRAALALRAQVACALSQPGSHRRGRDGSRRKPNRSFPGPRAHAAANLRQGSCFPSFIEPRIPAIRRCAGVIESYVNGTSTRKVVRIVEPLGVPAACP